MVYTECFVYHLNSMSNITGMVYYLTARQNNKEMISKALWCIKYALHNLSHEYYTLLIVLKMSADWGK